MSEPILLYCNNCGSDESPIFEDIFHDKLNQYPWGDIVCSRCKIVITTMHSKSEYRNVRIVGDKI